MFNAGIISASRDTPVPAIKLTSRNFIMVYIDGLYYATVRLSRYGVLALNSVGYPGEWSEPGVIGADYEVSANYLGWPWTGPSEGWISLDSDRQWVIGPGGSINPRIYIQIRRASDKQVVASATFTGTI